LESVSLQLSQRGQRLDDAVRKIRDELKSFDRYPQGFTFIYESSINDNLDALHTLIHKLNVPKDTWIMDLVKVWIYGEKYRAYGKQAAAGGGTVVSSEFTLPPTVTSGASSKNTDDAATPPAVTSSSSNVTTSVGEQAGTAKLDVYPNQPGGIPVLQTKQIDAGLTHNQFQRGSGSGDLTFNMIQLPGGHAHRIGDPATYTHYHTIPGGTHGHGMDHTHEVLGASHIHIVNVPNHTHSLVFGIYESPTATANISLKIVDPDNQETDLGVIGTGIFSKEAWDLTQYFTKKGNYQLIFSADGVARIRSMVFMQPFIQPEGEY